MPRASSGLPTSRRWAALGLAASGLPLLTVALTRLRGTLSLESVLLFYMLAVVVVAVVGGILPALGAAVASFLLVNWYFTTPYHTFVVGRRDAVIALVVFVLVAATVSVTVDLAARQRVEAARVRLEAELLSRFAAEPVAAASVDDVLEQIRATFGLTTVALVERRGDSEDTIAVVGPRRGGATVVTVPAGDGLQVVGEGSALFAEDRELLTRLARAAGRAVEGSRLASEAFRARELDEIDRLKSALLAAVGHDLRTPLAGIKAAASSLREDDVEWAPEDVAEFLATIEESADRLGDLIANLLDMSRLQSGVLAVDLRPVDVGAVVAAALHDRRRPAGHAPDADQGPEAVVSVPDGLPLARADEGLLERVIANVVDNARRHDRSGRPIQIDATQQGGAIRLRIIDHGPGVPADAWDHMFEPFQRLDDHTTGGVGLGLAIARGFTEAMGATLVASQTPGGGLTMILTLAAAVSPDDDRRQ